MKASTTPNVSNVVMKKSNVRWFIVAMLFIVTVVNYGDRATISIAGSSISKAYNLSPVAMGYIFSAFGWSYILGQVPGGWILDRFGSRKVFSMSLLLWSICTLLQGFVWIFSAFSVIVALFILRLLLGFAESPSLLANVRLVTAWFPALERGRASQIFNSGQYFATVVFAPLLGWITADFGWQYNFIFMGVVGILLSMYVFKTVKSPDVDSRVNQAELDYIREGGALVNMDQKYTADNKKNTIKWSYIKQLLGNRMMWGIYIGQYCITTLTYFFLTWFPIYLVNARHMSILKAGFVAVLPALMGFLGGIFGGVVSDYMLKKGYSLTVSRKTPIVIGMLVSMTIIGANYFDEIWIVVLLMSLSFFGKAFGGLGWTIVSDTSPKQIIGISGGVLNMFQNISAITTPIVIGYLVQNSGSYNGALVYVAANALVAMLSYLLIVGKIKRVELKDNY